MIKVNSYYLIVAFMVLSLVFSGCVSTPPPQATPTQTATPAPTPVPTESPSVEVLNAPATAVAGQSFEVTWRVNSPVQKNITHTAVHYGPEPKVEPLTLQSYPNLTTPQGGLIPATFKGNITINTPGVIYFRAHAIIDTVNYWTPEMTVTVSAPPASVTPKILVTSYPGSVNGDTNFTIQWEVSGGTQGVITQTAIYWGFNSGGANMSNYARSSTIQTGRTPQRFMADLKAPAGGTIYFRAFASIDGVNIYSQEYQIAISSPYTGGGGGY